AWTGPPGPHPRGPRALESGSAVVARSAVSTTGRSVSFVGALGLCASAIAGPNAAPDAPRTPAVLRNRRLEMPPCFFAIGSSEIDSSMRSSHRSNAAARSLRGLYQQEQHRGSGGLLALSSERSYTLRDACDDIWRNASPPRSSSSSASPSLSSSRFI